ncbi:MAG: flagellar export chaperone FlgN [Phycisphaerae bacterium]
MNEHIETSRWRDLLELLTRLQQMHVDLSVLIDRKVDAMRRNDLDTLRDTLAQEAVLVHAIQEREGMRRQLLDTIGEKMGWPAQTARALSMSQLASRIARSQRERLLAVGKKLREAVSRVARANRLAGCVAREINDHLRWVFASVKPYQSEPAGYTGAGKPLACSELTILDAVG